MDNLSIQLHDSQVEDLHLERFDNQIPDSEETMEFSLGVETRFPIDQELNHFFISFISELKLKEGLVLKLKYTSTFTANVALNDEFQNSHFPKINAPAIAFPYFRAFISTFLLNAGFEPVILPSINFTKFKNKDE